VLGSNKIDRTVSYEITDGSDGYLIFSVLERHTLENFSPSVAKERQRNAEK